MLEVADIHTYYGESHVLHGVSLKVRQGNTVALLGRNGMGKTTVARSIMGLTPPRHGTVRFKGREINGLEPYQIAQMGMALVPARTCYFLFAKCKGESYHGSSQQRQS